MSDPVPVPEPARPEEWAEVFRLLFGDRGPRERNKLVANALALLHKGEVDPGGLLVVRGPDGVEGAIACQPIPGHSGVVFPPHTSLGLLIPQLEDALLGRAVAWLRSRSVKLVQVMLAEGEGQYAPALIRNGFRRMTALVYLTCALSRPIPLPASRRLDFIPYNEEDPERFHETLAQTWQDSADCPELHGVLTVEETLDGHRAQGPGRWWLIQDGVAPAGVIITIEVPENRCWELAYLGVVPDARGRGIGSAMLLETLARAREAGAYELTLCVDERNTPAWQLYNKRGFVPFDRREVYYVAWK